MTGRLAWGPNQVALTPAVLASASPTLVPRSRTSSSPDNTAVGCATSSEDSCRAVAVTTTSSRGSPASASAGKSINAPDDVRDGRKGKNMANLEPENHPGNPGTRGHRPGGLGISRRGEGGRATAARGG